MPDEAPKEPDDGTPYGQAADSSTPTGAPFVAEIVSAPTGSLTPTQGHVANCQEQAPILDAETRANQPQAPPAPPKPATWKTVEPEEPWCPLDIESELGFKLEYKHAIAVSKIIGNDWLLAAATQRGRMHAHHGTYREDAFHDRLEKNFSFFCVCDGAGSSKLSRIGSEFTARHLSRVVGDELLEHEYAIRRCSQESLPINLQNIMHHGVAVVAELLVALAAKAKLEPKDLRCTVLTVLHYQHPTGGIFLCGNVGDGFIAVKRKDKPAERVSNSDSGVYSGEVLCFMPDPQVGEFYRASLEKIRSIPEEDVEAFMLCTDGVEDPFYPVIDGIYQQITKGFHSPINDVTYREGTKPSSVIRSASPGVELLKWLSFEKRGEFDDRTIIFAYRIYPAEIHAKHGALEHEIKNGSPEELEKVTNESTMH